MRKNSKSVIFGISALFSFSTAIVLMTAQPAKSGSVSNARVWQEPIAGIHELVLNDFEAPPQRWAAGHRGIDVAIEADQIFASPLNGWVHFAGVVVDRPVLSLIDTEGRLASFEPACTNRGVGAPVTAGQVVGWHCEALDGYREHCDQPCLHISARNQSGYLSPLHLIYGLSPSRLWPVPDWVAN